MKFLNLFKLFKLNKYRIVEEADKFYPEERFLLVFWSRYSKLDTIFLEGDVIYFNTLEEAKEFITTKIKLDKINYLDKQKNYS